MTLAAIQPTSPPVSPAITVRSSWLVTIAGIANCATFADTKLCVKTAMHPLNNAANHTEHNGTNAGCWLIGVRFAGV